MTEDLPEPLIMPEGALYSERYPMAMAYAAAKHAGQRRKDDIGTPYIAHPVAVSILVWQHADYSEFAADDVEDLAIAALLHDIAEDAGGQESLAEIRAMFGERVAQIVTYASDALPAPGETKAPWRERKERHLVTMRRLGQGDSDLGLLPDPGACLVIGSDKVHNLGETVVQSAGAVDEFWDRFNGGKSGTVWYYRSMRDALGPSLPTSLKSEFDRLLAQLPD